jgi:hypothetical protein
MIPARSPDHVYVLGPLRLELWRISGNDRVRWGYRLFDEEWSPSPVFEEDAFKMPAWATIEETALDVLSYLTLRKWDAEEWFFESYTPEQLRWRDERAEGFQQKIMEEARRAAARPVRAKHVLGVRKKSKGPLEWSPRKGDSC